METFIARQPIFDAQRKVYGYELFFRSGLETSSNIQTQARPLPK